MEDCIFCKIVRKEIPSDIRFEDDDVIVFPDIHPVKPIHLLVIPKKHIPELNAVEDSILFQKIGQTIQKMIRDNALQTKGYKIMNNGGGFQDVDHLHFHLIGPMGKPTSS